MLGRALRKGLAISATAEGRALLMGGSRTVSGISVSPSRSMAASAVFSATTLRADTVASLPIRFLERSDRERTPVFPDAVRALWSGRPNPQQTTGEFIASVVLSKLLWGNAYIFPRRSNGGDIVELWPLDPDRVTVEPLSDPIGALRFKVLDFEDVDNIPGRPVGMIHLRHAMLPGAIKGISPIEELAELVGMSLSSEEHAARFLGDGVHMSGVIEMAAGTKKDAARETWEGFQQMHAGPKKAGRVGVLVGGQFKPLTIPPNELQFLEQMKYSDAKIASGIYRVPPHMIGDTEKTTSWGTGIEEQSIGFVRHAVMPDIRAIEEAIETTLLAGTNIDMRFNVNALLRGAMAARGTFYAQLWNLGAVCADDIRGWEDLPPLPDGKGQIFYVPMNFVPAGTDPAAVPSAAKFMAQLLESGHAA